MRVVTIKGLTDGVNQKLSHEVEVVADVISMGKAIDYLIYEVELDWEDFVKFAKRHRIDIFKIVGIKEGNKYLLTAYDW